MPLDILDCGLESGVGVSVGDGGPVVMEEEDDGAAGDLSHGWVSGEIAGWFY